jgi:SAM-dependent methyltransferase
MSVTGLKKRILRAVGDWIIRKLHEFDYDLIKRKPRLSYPGEQRRFDYQRLHHVFDIPPGMVVLDVGGGHDPFPYATILSDFCLGDTSHRARPLVRDGRAFVVMDVQSIAMADKSVDFIYCSHTLEHVDDPVKACSEIMRVGKRGYIETPAFLSDCLFAWAGRTSHKWHVTGINGALAFFEYSERQKEGIRSEIWEKIIASQYHHPLQDVYYANLDLFNTMFSWKDRFQCVAFRLDGSIQTLGIDQGAGRDSHAGGNAAGREGRTMTRNPALPDPDRAYPLF